jgi:hypothetical protein
VFEAFTVVQDDARLYVAADKAGKAEADMVKVARVWALIGSAKR